MVAGHVLGIYFSDCVGVCGSMDPGNKCRDDGSGCGARSSKHKERHPGAGRDPSKPAMELNQQPCPDPRLRRGDVRMDCARIRLVTRIVADSGTTVSFAREWLGSIVMRAALWRDAFSNS